MKQYDRVLALRLRALLAAGIAVGAIACQAPDSANEQADTADPAAGMDAAETAAGAEDSLSIADAGFSTPESVLHDEAADEYIVSNINGDPLEKDGNGYLSRVAADGTVRDARWIDAEADEGVSLDAPKGMAISGDTLFVTDIDVVRLFDRETGEPLGDWPVEGASFLNDAAVGPDGVLYVTDSGLQPGPEGFAPAGTDAVYHFPQPGQPVAIAEGTELNGPNGVTAAADGIVVVPFGGNTVYRIAADGTRTTVAELPAGQLDGVVRLDDGSFLVSSWEGEAVYRVTGDGGVEPVVEGVPAPADIGYDAQRDRLLIPLFTDDRVEVRAVR